MDIAQLAKELASFLAPILPYLVKGSEMAVEEASKKFGSDAWNGAKALWSKLRPKVESKPAALEAAQDLAVSPNDDDALATLRQQLKKLFAEDESLTREVSHLWKTGTAAGMTIIATGDRSISIGGNVTGSTIITGDEKYIKP